MSLSPHPAPTRRPGRPRTSQGDTTADARQRLLDMALQVFSLQGFEQGSLRSIAEQAGLDPALVAHHFGSKALLWQAVVDEIAMRQRPHLLALQGIVAAPQPLLQRLRQTIDFLIDLPARHQEGFRLIRHALYRPGERLQYLTEQIARPYYALCAPLWQQAIDSGLLKSAHPAVFHILLMGAISSTLDAAPMAAQLANGELLPDTMPQELRAILQGHLPHSDATA